MPENNRIFDIMPKDPYSEDEKKNDSPPVKDRYLDSEPETVVQENDHPQQDQLVSTEEAVAEDDPALEDLDQNEEEDEDDEIIGLEWSAFDHEELNNRLRYFSVAGIIVAVLLAYIIYVKYYFGAVFLIVMFVVFIFYKLQKPREINYTLTSHGLYIGNKYYGWHEIHSFWFIETKKQINLHMLLNKKYMPQVTLDVTNIESEDVRNILQEHLPEQEGVVEPIVDRIIRLLKL